MLCQSEGFAGAKNTESPKMQTEVVLREGEQARAAADPPHICENLKHCLGSKQGDGAN
jgi:hypothetical protein